MNLIERIEGAEAVHPYWCDCAGCWTGITKCAPKPPTLWQRIIAALRAIGDTHDD